MAETMHALVYHGTNDLRLDFAKAVEHFSRRS